MLPKKRGQDCPTTALMYLTAIQSDFCFFHFTGVDEILADHIAHLFIRDPISLFAEKLDLNDEKDTDHFEVFACGKMNF